MYIRYRPWIVVGMLSLVACALMTAPAAAQEELRNRAELIRTLETLEEYIRGDRDLSDEQVAEHLEIIKEHDEVFGSHRTVVRRAFELVQTFEKEKGPLWVDHGNFNTRHNEPTGLNWAIFHVMQNIMDHVYTLENVENYERWINGFKFETSSRFPGPVDPPGDPQERYTVKIDGSSPEDPRHAAFGNDGFARKPTGAYLAPGSIATITVPGELVGQGYKVRVGAHSWDFSNRPNVVRLYRVSRVFPIEDRQVQVANPLGGGIYIEVPYLADAGVVEVTIQNAVRSPYFSAKSFHQTSLSEWQEVERHRDAPWADFQSEKYQMQVPTKWINDLDDPAALLEEWDAAVDAQNYLMGLPQDRNRETMYLQVDLQNRASVLAPGWPTVNDRYDPNNPYNEPVNHYLVRGPRYAPDYVFHEMGHQFRFKKPQGEMEAMVNLHHVVVMDRVYDMDFDEAFRTSRGSNNEFQTVDTTAIEWMTSFNFVQGNTMQAGEKFYQLKGHAKFADVGRLFGWEPLHKFFVDANRQQDEAREAGESRPWNRNNNNHEQYTVQMCKSSGIDLRPLMHFWGLLPDEGRHVHGEGTEVENLPPSSAIYDLLTRYKSLVPEDNQAFREFARQWWGQQPSIDGYTTQRQHARQWDDEVLVDDPIRPNGEKYDEQVADEIRARVQEIIDLYFPDGRQR